MLNYMSHINTTNYASLCNTKLWFMISDTQYETK